MKICLNEMLNLKRTYYLYAVILLLLLSGCEENVNYYNDEKPGSRNYEWTADTIPFNAGNVYYRMWGETPDDIWIIGVCTDDKESLIHYDGKNFKAFDKNISRPTNLYGLKSDDIWAGTFFGEFWHYDGSRWEMVQRMDRNNYNEIPTIWGITAVTKNEYYACGYIDKNDGNNKALLYKYDGNKWVYLKIPDIYTSFLELNYDNASGHIIIRASSFDGYNYHDEIYRYSNGKIEKMLSNIKLSSFNKIDGNIIISVDESGFNNLYKYNGRNFDKMLSFDKRFTYNIGGRNISDMFFYVLKDGTYGIGHYNGYDISFLSYYDAVVHWGLFFNNEILMIMEDSKTFKTYILKGKAI